MSKGTTFGCCSFLFSIKIICLLLNYYNWSYTECFFSTRYFEDSTWFFFILFCFLHFLIFFSCVFLIYFVFCSHGTNTRVHFAYLRRQGRWKRRKFEKILNLLSKSVQNDNIRWRRCFRVNDKSDNFILLWYLLRECGTVLPRRNESRCRGTARHRRTAPKI